MKRATADRGVDVILDMVGGAYAKRNLESLAPDQKAAVVRDLTARVWPHLGSRIDPVIDRVFPLDQAGSSHALMESSRHIGKILLEVKH